jgi:hypothetical protein
MVLTCPKPIRGYPFQLATVADHLRKRRLDLELTKVEAGRRLGIGPWTYTRWERGKMTIEVHYYARIIVFLGYSRMLDVVRVARAWDGMASGKRSLQALSDGVDFPSVRTLIEHFRFFTGLSPRDCARRLSSRDLAARLVKRLLSGDRRVADSWHGSAPRAQPMEIR